MFLSPSASSEVVSSSQVSRLIKRSSMGTISLPRGHHQLKVDFWRHIVAWFFSPYQLQAPWLNRGKGRGRENRWRPHVQKTWNLHKGPFFPAGTPPVKSYSLLTTNLGLIFHPLPTLGAMAGGRQLWGHVLLVPTYSTGCGEYEDTRFDHADTSRWPARSQNIDIWNSFSGFRCHGAIGEGEGESLVSPHVADMEPVWRPFHFSRKLFWTEVFAVDCKKKMSWKT